MKKKAHEKVRPYLMILPAMLGILVFTIYPVIKLIQLSFMNVNMLDDSKTKFVGLENYQKVFARPDFIKSLNNTILYTAAVVILITLLALILAVWLNSKRSAMNSVVQAVVFSPHVVAIVSIALIWQWMMEPNFGLFNYVLKFLGLPTSQWLTSSDTAMACVIAISVWKAVGYDMLIFLAALQGVPKELYESAKLDNAGKWTVFWKITIPMVSPQLFFTLITRTISSFKVFDTVRVLTEGGPNNATTTLVYTIYREALFNMRIGYSAVIGVVLLVIVGILTAVYFVGLSKKVHYQ